MRLSRAVRIRRTTHSSSGNGGAQRERSSASLPGTAWHGDLMCFAASHLRALFKNVILAEVFLIIINHVF